MTSPDNLFASGTDWMIEERDGDYWLTYLSGHFQTREETSTISKQGAEAMKSASPPYFDAATISMPHRYCVRYQRRDLVVDYEVEATAGSLIIYVTGPDIVNGSTSNFRAIEDAVLTWLKQKFGTVITDLSDRPSGF